MPSCLWSPTSTLADAGAIPTWELYSPSRKMLKANVRTPELLLVAGVHNAVPSLLPKEHRVPSALMLAWLLASIGSNRTTSPIKERCPPRARCTPNRLAINGPAQFGRYGGAPRRGVPESCGGVGGAAVWESLISSCQQRQSSLRKSQSGPFAWPHSWWTIFLPTHNGDGDRPHRCPLARRDPRRVCPDRLRDGLDPSAVDEHVGRQVLQGIWPKCWCVEWESLLWWVHARGLRRRVRERVGHRPPLLRLLHRGDHVRGAGGLPRGLDELHTGPECQWLFWAGGRVEMGRVQLYSRPAMACQLSRAAGAPPRRANPLLR